MDDDEYCNFREILITLLCRLNKEPFAFRKSIQFELSSRKLYLKKKTHSYLTMCPWYGQPNPSEDLLLKHFIPFKGSGV